MIEFISKIEIIDSDLSLESESDHNRWSNLDSHFDSLTTNRFDTSNRISLLPTNFRDTNQTESIIARIKK